MKYCKKCDSTKPVEEFSWANKAKGTRQSNCKECVNAYAKARYEAKKPQLLAEMKVYYEANRDHKRAKMRDYYSKNKDAIYASQRAWRAANPERWDEYQRRYRASKYSGVTQRWVKSEETPGQCYWCGDDISHGHHDDHIMPLSKGGSDDASNRVKTCQPCNNRKYKTHPLVWIASLM
jgi:hypothetical protein